ncbi:tetratricopeptide repeat protein [Sodalinema gerasimenkoae]|uniref:tetratricopeptide repeat protein n=1 Tax=Sodalinema gerasimenkoae TaxID=2862348 RepID=UPI00135CAA20|nr:hypothetical protein [Sodalinema gerasimenkoae]
MLYFQTTPSPQADSDPNAPSLQGLIREDDAETLVLLDWVFQPTDSDATSGRHESVLVRLPKAQQAQQAPPQPPTTSRESSRGDVPTLDVVSRPSQDSEPEFNQPSLSLGLAVGLGVNLLALVGGAYLLQGTVPPSSLAQVKQTQPLESPDSVEASHRLDTQARSWIKLAQHRAQQRDFQGAIIALEQIPVGSSYYPKLQPKLREYQQKREIRATWLLQQAYDQAAQGEFSQALGYLQLIPPGTEARDRAREKLAQYQEQKTIRATWLLQQAYDQAAQGQFSEAIAYLQQIPQGTPAYSTARLKLDEYRLKAQGSPYPGPYRS